MTGKFDAAVYIGRYQPWHKGHEAVAQFGADNAHKLLVLCGSANRHRTTRNPFSFSERYDNIAGSLADCHLIEKTEIVPLDDDPYNLQGWITDVQRAVAKAAPAARKIAIIGHDRDASSFYLRQFPQWTFLPPKTDVLHINATSIRHALFSDTDLTETSLCDLLPTRSASMLAAFRQSPVFLDLQEEYRFEISYRERWGRGPFQTVDNVVIKSGHVLVVRRKDRPGKGLLALPGGHLEYGETCADAAIREWWEEARLAGYATLQDFAKAIWPHFRGRERFDDPLRSCRAHVISETFYYKLPDEAALPAIISGDDAADAFWLPLAAVRPQNFFEDHAFIIAKISKFF